MEKVLYFVAGAAVGSLVAWKITSMKCEERRIAELEEVRETYERRAKKEEAASEEVEDEPDEDEQHEEDVQEYRDIVTGNGYTHEENGRITNDDPYVISPDEFGELDDYETVSLYHYADGFVADEMDELLEDLENVIGYESLNHFGEYEDDSVFVRNDRLKTDYEILLSLQNYLDIKNPD